MGVLVENIDVAARRVDFVCDTDGCGWAVLSVDPRWHAGFVDETNQQVRIQCPWCTQETIYTITNPESEPGYTFGQAMQPDA